MLLMGASWPHVLVVHPVNGWNLVPLLARFRTAEMAKGVLSTPPQLVELCLFSVFSKVVCCHHHEGLENDSSFALQATGNVGQQ